MRYLLDTNTCIGVLNGTSAPLRARQQATPASKIRLCSVVKAELLYGAEKSARPEQVKQKLTVSFARFKSMPFDDTAAAAYGELRAAVVEDWESGTP